MRRNRLSGAGIDRGWPHQVVLPEARCTGAHRHVQDVAAGLSMSPRGHSVIIDDEWHQVFCFSEKADAEKFREQFDGQRFDPKRRGRGKSWQLLREPKKR